MSHDWINAKIDKDRLNLLFKRLRAADLMARQDFMCCGGCGHSQCHIDLHDDNKPRSNQAGYVFYHNQSTWGALNGGDLHLYYGGRDDEIDSAAIGQRITNIALQLGFNVTWNGSEHTAVALTGMGDYCMEIRDWVGHLEVGA
jgi:hypothetical protein